MPFKTKEARAAYRARPDVKAKAKAWRDANPNYHAKRIATDHTKYLAQLAYGQRHRRPQDWVSVDHLIRLWRRQNGLCAVSGVAMTHHGKAGTAETNASVDRIDSSKGYTTTNTQLVCRRVNAMKSDLPMQEFITWCERIAQTAKIK